MKINLKSKCGRQTITRENGQVIADMITSAWSNENVITIDFSNILIASVSFMDEAFGKLAFKYSKEDLQKKLRFINVNEYDRALLNDILIARYRQKQLHQNGFSKPKEPKARLLNKKLRDALEKS